MPNPFVIAWFAFLFFAEPIERAAHHRLVDASSAVNVGMTPSEVRSVLGDPAAEYAKRGIIATLWLGSPRPKQWMYGTWVNLDYVLVPGLPFLNLLPLNIRVAHYADEDLVIDWDSENRVSSIKRPKFEVPDIAFGMLDAAVFLRDVLRLFVFRPPLDVGIGK